MELAVKEEILARAKIASNGKTSLICFSPRLSGKTKLYEEIKLNLRDYGFAQHDNIERTDKDEQILIEDIKRIEKEQIFVIASSQALRWAMK